MRTAHVEQLCALVMDCLLGEFRLPRDWQPFSSPHVQFASNKEALLLFPTNPLSVYNFQVLGDLPS